MMESIRALSLDMFVFIVGPLLLAAALVYGIAMWRRRSLASKVHSDQATRRLYEAGAEQEKRHGEA
jgi:hypothetical protein